ncbi:MAG: hypothetical protein ABI378_15905 [Chitinophagaceae bacterium]
MHEIESIIEEWNLDSGLRSKEEIIAALAARVEFLIANDFMGFIQLMYRLDVSEKHLEPALDAEDTGFQVANLIWDRQVQKSILRKMTPPPKGGDEELLW